MTRPASRFSFRSLALLSIFFLAAASPGEGQEFVRDPATGGTERVIVETQSPEAELPAVDATTATRLPARILDTPRSVGVINRQTLDDRQVDDPQEAVQNVSGVVRSAAFSGVGENYALRGFLQANLFKDGFRAGTTLGSDALFGAVGSTDVANLERIEVLKGPAAILYGRGQPGGLVNYVTRQAYFGNGFSVEQQFGSYGFYRTEADANWNAVPGKLALRLDGAYETGDSFIDLVHGERYIVAPSALWQIAPGTTLTFRGEYSHDDRSTFPGLPYINGRVLPGVPHSRYFGDTDFTHLETDTFRGLLTLQHRWSDWALTTLSVHGRRAGSEGGYYLLFPFAIPTLQDPVTGDIQRAATPLTTAEENLSARLDQLFTWTLYESSSAPDARDAGKAVTTTVPPRKRFAITNQLLISPEYERQTNLSDRALSVQTPLNPYRPVYTGYSPSPLFPGVPPAISEHTDVRAESYSVLFQDQLSIGDFALLSFAERTEWFASDFRRTYPAGVGLPNTAVRQGPFTFNPSAALVIKPVRPVSLYFSYAESTNPFINLSAVTLQGNQLDPERARQFELGAKAELLHGKLLATAAIFQINRTDVAAADPTNPFFSINAGEERSRGFECDLNGEPLPGWRVIVNYAYIDARVIDDPSGLTTGNRRFGVPENSGGFFTTYEFQNGPLKGFGLGGGMNFADRVEVDTTNTGKLSGYAQTDLVGFYHRGPFRAQINVKNLFDNEFYYAQDQPGAVQPAQARTINGSVTVKF